MANISKSFAIKGNATSFGKEQDRSAAHKGQQAKAIAKRRKKGKK